MIRTTLAASLLLTVSTSALSAQDVYETEQANFRVETVAEGLNMPWSVGFLPSGEMLVTERDGGSDGLRIIDADGNLRAEPVTGLPDDVVVNRQAGLFDAIPHPEFADNRLVYISYAQGTREAHRTALVRGRLSDDLSTLENVEELFAVNFDIATTRHHGGKILFDRDGYLWLSLGDGGDHMDEAQDPSNHIGTLIRLNDDGTVPSDNPFAGGNGGAPEVWSYGHRNIQGLAQHPQTGTVWSHEHGPRGGDEVNIHLTGGLNYGWPEITYGINYNGTIITEERARDGLEQPIWYWNPSIANSGAAFYTGDAFPHWQNDFFVGALAGMHIARLETDGDRVIGQERLLEDLEERIRDVRTGPDGFLYITTDSDEGRVLRLVPAE
jgi:glucose/arabinose dehydrogenase